jgi:VCBS repeat-containing protein
MRVGNVITADDTLNGVESVQATVIDAAGKSSITVPGADFILTAQYARIGSNLVLTSPDGDTEFVIRDYFATETPPDLFGDTGARIAGDLAARLSGPLAPGQYAQAGPASQSESIGRVETVSGTATATRADGTRVTLDKDSTVHAGDIIETAAGASLGIVFVDKTTFAVGENARMVLDEMIFDPGSNNVSSVTSLLQGAFVIITGEIGKLSPESVVINTPAAQIGIRGTGMAFNINQVGAESTYTLLFGAIVLRNAISELLLDNLLNTVAFTSFNLPPGPVFTLTQQQFDTIFGTAKGISDQLAPFSVNLGEINPGAGGNDPGAGGNDPGEAGDGGTVDPNVSQGALSSPPVPAPPGVTNFFTGGESEETSGGSTDGGSGPTGGENTDDGGGSIDGGGSGTPALPAVTTFTLNDDAFNAISNQVFNNIAFNLLANDLPFNQAPLEVTGFDAASAQGALVSVNADGTFLYDPTGVPAFQNLLAGQTINDSFTYTAGDDIGGDQTATVTFAVTGVVAADIIGSPGNDVLIGDANDNIIQALGGNDFLTGGKGTDVLFGGLGNDTYFYNGGDGVDILIDDGGFDILSLDGAANDTITGVQRAGDDLVVLFLGGGAVVGSDHFAGVGREIEQVDIPSENSTLNIRADVTQTDGSDELLVGGDNNDVINGQGGDDFIIGGFGDDTLDGGTGLDDIIGGFGSDTMTGGAGVDIFLWRNPGELTFRGTDTLSVGDPRDTLTDFQSGVDKLEFDSGSFGFLGSFTAQDGVDFHSINNPYDGTNSGHAGGDPHFVYSTVDETLYYDASNAVLGYSIVATVGPGADDISASDVEVFEQAL